MCGRAKLPVRETIPPNFAHFMREVVAALDREDPAAWTESDDLLQSDRGYGGLYDQALGRYGFEFLLHGDEESREAERPICWYFDLDRQQLRDVASGKMTQIELWRCEPDCGLRFARRDDYCDLCDPAD